MVEDISCPTEALVKSCRARYETFKLDFPEKLGYKVNQSLVCSLEIAANKGLLAE